jgi:hypothetical protein
LSAQIRSEGQTGVLFALGMIERLRNLPGAKTDEIGLELEEERLPKRINLGPRCAKKGKRTPSPSGD